MGVFRIGEAVCNNCVHWRCHSERRFQGNPPRDVYTASNCDKCGLTGRATLSKSSCGMFRHIGGVLTTYSSPASIVANTRNRESNPGENYLNAVMGFIRDSQAIDAASRLAKQYFHEKEERLSHNREIEKLQMLIRHGMNKDATAKERQSFEVLYENAVADDPEAQLYLAYCFQHGEYGAVKNSRLAAKWCLKAACHENADAQNLLGTFYLNGFGVERDARKAGALFRSAAKLGSHEAERNYRAMVSGT